MTNPNLPPPTDEGRAIINAVASGANVMVNALAGTGKTTVIQQFASSLPPTGVLALAFNKKNAKDLEAKLPSGWACKTLNGLGHGAIAAGSGRRGQLILETGKIGNIINSVAKAMGYERLSEDDWTNVMYLVRQARMIGLMPSRFLTLGYKTLVEDDIETWQSIGDGDLIEVTSELHALAHASLVESVDQARMGGVIDFDDQIYLSALGPALFRRFPHVIIDEAQDLSPLNHIQLKKASAGQIIAVGDPKQAIYAFRGADTESMAKIKALRPEWTELPLSMTWRCPTEVVARQLRHAPNYVAAPPNPTGLVLDWRQVGKDPAQPTTWDLADFPSKSTAILCRNNSPLMSAALRLIRAGVGVNFLGRDIGKSLIRLAAKICGKNPDLPIAECVMKINSWRSREIANATMKGNDSQVSMIHDRAECLLAMVEAPSVKDLGGMIRALEVLFSEPVDGRGLITLSTGHRAKGLEWHTVVHLDPWRVPSKHAKDSADLGDFRAMTQEKNLRYVIETRTLHTLVLANLDTFQPEGYLND